jgi:hypothetical protein
MNYRIRAKPLPAGFNRFAAKLRRDPPHEVAELYSCHDKGVTRAV